MSIMELGALGEFFGAIAVVGTLIFLAIQVLSWDARGDVRRMTLAHENLTGTRLAEGPGGALTGRRIGHGAWTRLRERKGIYCLRPVCASQFLICKSGNSSHQIRSQDEAYDCVNKEVVSHPSG